ncbi:MAG: hypothetical protein ABJN26_16010 [Stappiaceae bacterium]
MTTVDTQTNGEERVSFKRRCHIEDGNSLVEELAAWGWASVYATPLNLV